MTANEADRLFLASLTVLYVEDETSVLNMTAEFLQRRVGRLCLAMDGEEGLEVFRREAPQIVITDIMMPRMDGLAMAEAIKAEAPGTPIVIITAFEQTQFLMRSITLGVDRYVLKPVQADLLEAALLHCARLLRAEEDLRQRQRLERELLLAHEHEAMCILARGMAHDYNNLLQAILSGVEVATHLTEPGGQARLLLELVQQHGATARELGRKLLDLGRLTDVMDEEGHLEPLVERALEAGVAGAGLRIQTHFPPGLPSIRYNRARLGQALAALIRNAREAMADGGTLQVEAALRQIGPGEGGSTLKPGRYVTLRLKDSGTGIPPEALPLIFDPYFSTKDNVGSRGRGLGLAICRSILLAHGGQVTASSVPGEGSVFHMFLPAAPQ